MLKLLVFWLLFPSCFIEGQEDEHIDPERILDYLLAHRETPQPTERTLPHPHISDSCKALLPWSCLCEDAVVNEPHGQNTFRVKLISCINTRIPHSNILATVQKFRNVESIVFHGNNFTQLRERFFGPALHKKLLYLNLTRNNVTVLHQDTFLGLPSLQSLDLSDNNITLRKQSGDWAFLRPVRFLRRLLLRNAFDPSANNPSAQLTLLELGLEHAMLRDLQFLDLSHNQFEQFPSTLLCWTPSLTHLLLAHNHLHTLHFDEKCGISELKVIDLQSNRLIYFTYDLARTASRLPPMSVQVNHNPFDCTGKTCASMHSAMWFRVTPVIKDKDKVRCHADGEHKFNRYMMTAPVDTKVKCASFGVGGEPVEGTMELGSAGSNPMGTVETDGIMEQDDTEPRSSAMQCHSIICSVTVMVILAVMCRVE